MPMPRENFVFAVAPVFASIACAAPEPQVPTPYQPLDRHGGYTDERIGENRYIVTFRGNEATFPEQVQAMAYRRAWALCMSGFDILSERDMSVTEKAEDTTSCVVRYGVSHDCRTIPGGTIVRPRWQMTVACR
jgi:hypothetical protein